MLSAVAIASMLVIGQSSQALEPPRPAPPPRPVSPPAMPYPAVRMPEPPPPAAPDRSRTVRPQGNAGLWVSSDDYPARALREGREGAVTVQLGIGPDGRVFTCGIRLSSASDDLDLAACRMIMRRARFDPALDANGRPTIAMWPIAVRWAIPAGADTDHGEDGGTAPVQATRAAGKPWLAAHGRGPAIDPRPVPLPIPLAVPGVLVQRDEFRPPAINPQSGAVVLAPAGGVWLLRVAVDSAGRVSGCAPMAASGDPAFDRLLCQRYAERVTFEPARDEAGQPVASWLYALWTLPVAPPPPPVP